MNTNASMEGSKTNNADLFIADHTNTVWFVNNDAIAARKLAAQGKSGAKKKPYKTKKIEDWRHRIPGMCDRLGCKMVPEQKGPFYGEDDINICADLKHNKCRDHTYLCSSDTRDENGDYLCGKPCAMRDVENRGVLTRDLNGYSYWYCSGSCFRNNCKFPTALNAEYMTPQGGLRARTV